MTFLSLSVPLVTTVEVPYVNVKSGSSTKTLVHSLKYHSSKIKIPLCSIVVPHSFTTPSGN